MLLSGRELSRQREQPMQRPRGGSMGVLEECWAGWYGRSSVGEGERVGGEVEEGTQRARS